MRTRILLAALCVVVGCSGSSDSTTGTDSNITGTGGNGIASGNADAGTSTGSTGTATGSTGGTGSTGTGTSTGSTGTGTGSTGTGTGTGSTGGGTGTGTGSTGGGSTSACLASRVSSALGKPGLMVGADMSNAVASSAPFDIRSQYLSGAIGDGDSVCTSCGSGCSANGVSCANGSCDWWGCWQDLSKAPGQYVKGLIATAAADHQIALFTYYELLQSSGASEGAGEVAAANNAAFMKRYFNDWRFFLQTIGSSPALVNIEPDFWGYAEQLNSNAHAIPAAVSAAGSDCSGIEQTIAGLGQCMIAMARTYAKNAKVGFNAAPWATNYDVYQNTSASFDVTAEAKKEAAFLLQLGAANSDFVTLDVSDRDAGWEQSNGAKNAFWDATNAKLPNYAQAFKWATALTEGIGIPGLWWQVQLGNMSLNNTSQHWQDNALDYFFDHPDQVVATHAFGVVYGAGQSDQTNPSTDGGHLVARIQAYASAGEAAVCQ